MPHERPTHPDWTETGSGSATYPTVRGTSHEPQCRARGTTRCARGVHFARQPCHSLQIRRMKVGGSSGHKTHFRDPALPGESAAWSCHSRHSDDEIPRQYPGRVLDETTHKWS